MIKLSFIVPVYNVEKYLLKCVNSLIHQDFSDYEIVLIDDGSTDGSVKICDDLSETIRDERLAIMVIHQENAGLSAARNAGLMAAKGEYVCFVDSDDYWEENVLGGLMAQIERDNLDVLRFDYQNVRIKNEGIRELESEGEYEVFEPNKTPRYIDKRTDVVNGEIYLNERMSYACYAVMFIIKRSMLIGDRKLEIGDCLFTEGIYFEDTEWTPRMLLKARRVNSTPIIAYDYFWRTGSITQKFDIAHINKKICSLIQVNQSLQSILPKVHEKRWIEGCMADNTYCILNNAATYDYKSVPYWTKVVQKHKMLPLRGYKVRKITMLRYRIINLSPLLYCWLRHLRMKYF